MIDIDYEWLISEIEKSKSGLTVDLIGKILNSKNIKWTYGDIDKILVIINGLNGVMCIDFIDKVALAMLIKQEELINAK